MKLKFATDYPSILDQVASIDPIAYGRTRNYTDGAVTYLSPYISRGVISTKQVLQTVLAKGYQLSQIEAFVKELCWRDYFQRVAQVKDLDAPIKQAQEVVLNHQIPSQLLSANTGINGIDAAIKMLYEDGYMHNHCRMYTASLACNIAKSHWHYPAKWMYYHLLDGDWASNACSWQWVAGANSGKKYYANQENINKYTHTQQAGTYLDKTYEALETMEVPNTLLTTQNIDLELNLPEKTAIQVDPALPTYIYNYYNLDPLWHKDEPANRILLIEPEVFEKYPVAKKCIDFMQALSKNIPQIKLYVGSFQSFAKTYQVNNSIYKEHPFNANYFGQEEQRDWIAPEISGYYPSFFAYWKKVAKHLKQQPLDIGLPLK